MSLLLNLVSLVLLLGGAFFTLVGGIGIIRMPDVFTRLHAGSVTDTMGAGLILTGLMIHEGISLTTVKLILVLVFLWLSSPVSTYALARAALRNGEEPYWVEEFELPSTARIPGRSSATADPQGG
jgi:multicomponent Na+:H+ antiporter subunit G